jgi:hypothetical protein
MFYPAFSWYGDTDLTFSFSAALLLEVDVVSRVVVPVALRVNRTALSRIHA